MFFAGESWGGVGGVGSLRGWLEGGVDVAGGSSGVAVCCGCWKGGCARVGEGWWGWLGSRAIVVKGLGAREGWESGGVMLK